MTLSVGEVAGMINVGVVFGILPERTNAVTWSVAARFLNGSLWPTLLGTDAAAVSKVSKRVVSLSAFATVNLVLLATAAVVTPLGLYNAIIADSPRASTFVHVADKSPIGQATLPRQDYNTSRLCGLSSSCPGQYHGISLFQNESGIFVNYDSDDAYISSVVPANLTALFSSGREGDRNLVATPFDIQFRSYTLVSERPDRKSVLSSSYNDLHTPKVDHFQRRTQAEFAYGDMLLLEESFVIRDGIIADMQNGGLGFRNHTVPVEVHFGQTWTEGLLWLKPETACVKNNLTIQFRLPLYSGDAGTVYLIDNGGVTHKPQYPFIDLNETQIRPELYGRAHKGATLVNFNLRQQLGISASNASWYGKKFDLHISTSSSQFAPGLMSIGGYDYGFTASLVPDDPRRNITKIDDIGLVTSGYGDLDIANFSHIANVGGVVLGAFESIDGNKSEDKRNDPGSNYSAPLFSCSTSIRAFIMDVTFFMNGTSGLENLQVLSATPRTYTSNATTPLWGQENTLQMYMSNVQPLWGLVGDEYEFDERLWSIRRDFMYLPAGASASTSSVDIYDSLGSKGPIQALINLYDTPIAKLDLPDYTGKISLPLRQRWQRLSKSESGIANMIGLIWTDITANYVTSARSQLNSQFPSVSTYAERASQTVPTSQNVTAVVYDRVIRYHMPYAILAIILLTVYLIVLITALVMCLTRKSTLHLLRTLLNQTSVGRAVTVERQGSNQAIAEQVRTMSTAKWVGDYGGENIGIVKERRKVYKRGGSAHDTAHKYQPVQSISGPIAKAPVPTEPQAPAALPQATATIQHLPQPTK